MRYLLILSVLFSFGCASRTKYKPMDGSGGYADKAMGKGIYISRFAGNAYTNQQDAQTYTGFRAVEVCREKGYKVARILGFQNLSTSKTVQKTSNYNYKNPTYYSGTANTNTNYNIYGNTLNSRSNTNVNGQVYGGSSYGGSNTWNETYNFPTYDVMYSCENKIYLMGINLDPVKNENIKEFSKDTLDALAVSGFGDNSPNEEVLQLGDIILKVNGRRVVNVKQIGRQLKKAKNKNAVTTLIIREGKKKNVQLTAKDGTEFFLNQNNQVVQASCNVPEIKKRPICSSRGLSSIRD